MLQIMDVKVMSIYLLLSRVKSNLYSFKVLQISNVVVTKIRIVLLTYWSHRGPYEWGRGWDAYWTGGHRPRHHHGNSVHSRSAGEVASSLGWLVRTDCPCERKTGFRWIGQRKNIQRTKKKLLLEVTPTNRRTLLIMLHLLRIVQDSAKLSLISCS